MTQTNGSLTGPPEEFCAAALVDKKHIGLSVVGERLRSDGAARGQVLEQLEGAGVPVEPVHQALGLLNNSRPSDGRGDASPLPLQTSLKEMVRHQHGEYTSWDTYSHSQSYSQCWENLFQKLYSGENTLPSKPFGYVIGGHS